MTPGSTCDTSPAAASDLRQHGDALGREERAVLLAQQAPIDLTRAQLRQELQASSAAGGPATTGASATGISLASTALSIASSTPPAQSALAITATPERDAGMKALREPKPLTPPPCCSTSTGPRSRIAWPQP